MSFDDLDLPLQQRLLIELVHTHSHCFEPDSRDLVTALTLQLSYGPCRDYVQCSAFSEVLDDEFRSKIAKWTALGSMRKTEAIGKMKGVLDERLPEWRSMCEVPADSPRSPTKLSSSRAQFEGGKKMPPLSLDILETLLGSFISNAKDKAKQFREQLISTIAQKASRTTESIKKKASPKKRKDLTMTKSALLDLRTSQRQLIRDLKAKMSQHDESNESLAMSLAESSRLICRLLETVCDTSSQTRAVLYIRRLEEDLQERMLRVKEELLNETEAYCYLVGKKRTLESQLEELKVCMMYLKEMHDPVISIFKISRHNRQDMLAAIAQAGGRFEGIQAISDLLESRLVLRATQQALLEAKEVECNDKRRVLSAAQDEEYKHNDRFAKQLKGKVEETGMHEAKIGDATALLDKIEEKRQIRLHFLSELERRREMLLLLETKRQNINKSPV
jgi:hypothetical protein